MLEYKKRRSLLLRSQRVNNIHASASTTPPRIPLAIVTAIEGAASGGANGASVQNLLLGEKAKLFRRKGWSDETCMTVTLIVCRLSERFGSSTKVWNDDEFELVVWMPIVVGGLSSINH